MTRLRVGIFAGGRSAEHEVSVASAESVLRAIDRERYEPYLVYIDRSGRWHLPGGPAPELGDAGLATQLVAQGGGGMQGNGNAGNIHQFKRPHADFESALGGLLDGGDIGHAFFQQAHGFIEERDKKTVDCKPGGVLDHDGRLGVQLGG